MICDGVIEANVRLKIGTHMAQAPTAKKTSFVVKQSNIFKNIEHWVKIFSNIV